MSHYQNFEAPFEIPSSWDWCNLINCCHIAGRIGFRGYTKEDLVSETDGAITLSPSNIMDGNMDFSKCTYISWGKYEESPEIKVENGDILLVKTGSSYGKCALVNNLPNKATINPQFVVLKHVNINPQYLTYVLQSKYARDLYDNFVLGTAIPTFTQEKLGNSPIPLPPLNEQNRIVKKINSILSLTDNLDVQVSFLSERINLTKSKILELAMQGRLVAQDATDEPAAEMLRRINPKAKIITDNPHYPQLPDNWALTSLTDLCESRLGKTLNSETDNGIPQPYLCTINVKQGYFDLTVVKKAKIELSEYERYSVYNGDLLICEGGDVGRCAIWDGERIFYQNSLHRLRPKECVDLKFLYYTLLYSKYKQWIEELCSGVTMKHLTTKVLSRLIVPLPPLSEQIRIVEAIEKWFNILNSIQDIID